MTKNSPDDSTELPQSRPVEDTNQPNHTAGREPRPCLGYTSGHRIVNGIPTCVGCEMPIKDHPIVGRTMSQVNPPSAPPVNDHQGKCFYCKTNTVHTEQMHEQSVEDADTADKPSNDQTLDDYPRKILQKYFDRYNPYDGEAEQTLEALIQWRNTAVAEELKQLKKQATEHCAYKVGQYWSELDTEDVRLAVPTKKIDARIKDLSHD